VSAVPPATQLVHQALFGYSGGHRLLEASTALDPAVEGLLARLSDDTGAVAVRGFDGYLSGYPLPGDLYALSRTWAAVEARRPGAVWTHVLLLNAEQLSGARLDTHNVFRRPAHGAPPTGYRNPVALRQRAHVDAATADYGRWSPVIESLFAEQPQPAWLTSPTSATAEQVVLRLWWWQWPALRRRFSFCLGAAGPRSGWWGEFQLLVVPPSLSRTAALDLGPEPTEVSRVGKAVAEDLGRDESPLGRFCRFAGAESADMSTVSLLVNVWIETTGASKASAASCFDRLARRVAARHPDPREMRRLKRLLIMPDGHLPAAWTDRQVARALAGHPLGLATAAVDVDVDRLIHSVAKAPEDLLRLLDAADSGSSRGTVTDALASAARELFFGQATPNWLSKVAAGNPQLAAKLLTRDVGHARMAWAAAFWDLDPTTQDGIWEAATAKESLVWLAVHNDAGGLRLLERCLVGVSESEEVLASFISELTAWPTVLGRWIGTVRGQAASAAVRLAGSLPALERLLLLALVDPSDHVVVAARFAPWRGLGNELRGSGPAAAHLVVLTPAERPSKSDILLASRAFAVAWASLAAGDTLVWQELKSFPVTLGRDEDWDHARRLSRAFAARVLDWDRIAASRSAAEIALAAARRESLPASEQLLHEMRAILEMRQQSKGNKKRKKSLAGQAWEVTQEILTYPFR
jgi:hypothetical protein